MPNNQPDIEKYVSDYKLLEIRCGVLEEERMEYMGRIAEAKLMIKAKEQTVQAMTSEKEDCLARLRKVQQELELIKEFEEKQMEELEELRSTRQKAE